MTQLAASRKPTAAWGSPPGTHTTSAASIHVEATTFSINSNQTGVQQSNCLPVPADSRRISRWIVTTGREKGSVQKGSPLHGHQPATAQRAGGPGSMGGSEARPGSRFDSINDRHFTHLVFPPAVNLSAVPLAMEHRAFRQTLLTPTLPGLLPYLPYHPHPTTPGSAVALAPDPAGPGAAARLSLASFPLLWERSRSGARPRLHASCRALVLSPWTSAAPLLPQPASQSPRNPPGGLLSSSTQPNRLHTACRCRV